MQPYVDPSSDRVPTDSTMWEPVTNKELVFFTFTPIPERTGPRQVVFKVNVHTQMPVQGVSFKFHNHSSVPFFA